MRALSVMSTIALLALAAPASAVEALPVATGTAEDIPGEGLFTIDCLPSSTCDATIQRTGPDRYRFEWVATDRTGEREFCRYTADLALGEATATDVRWTNVLVGTLSGTGQKVMALAMPDNRLLLSTEADVCPGVKRPDGMFAMNGFYNRLEGDE